MAAVVVRVWSGTVNASDAEAYLQLMRDHAIPDYRAVPGNLDAQVWHRPEADGTVRFTTVSWWESRDAVRAFAGDDIETARYYDFDDRFLIDRGPVVVHHEVLDVS
jgi:heme-degrading monooxygenase HmoA